MVVEVPTPKRISIEKLAWAIVLGAFLIFCLICAGSTLGVYYFFFESSVAVAPVLQVGRGTAVLVDADLNERPVRMQQFVTSFPSIVSTDAQTQVTLNFLQNQDDTEVLIAAFNLRPDSVVQLRQAQAPRFSWSNTRYDIEMRDFTGAMDIWVTTQAEHPISVRIHTVQGAFIHITQRGRYVVDATEARVRLITRDGQAFLHAVDRQKARVVPSQHEGRLVYGHGEPVVTQARVNVIENGDFVFNIAQIDRQLDDTNSDMVMPERWGCGFVYEGPPRGERRVDYWQGRPVIRLLRNENADTHGETWCRQPYAGAGLDVRDQNYLELETTFFINYQSLDQCGTQASECPVMLDLIYEDINGVERRWLQGFYYYNDPAWDFRNRCDTCFYDEHRQINEKAWYTFRSGNLFTVLEPDAPPAFIKEIKFYASGHEYDVVIAEIMLITGIADVRPPEVPGETAP